MQIVNKNKIIVFAMKRSGQHAIINWILLNSKGHNCFLNNCDPNTNPFLTCKDPSGLAFKGNINMEKEINGVFSKKNYLIYNYEDHSLKNFKEKFFNKNHNKWVGKSKNIINLIILRDPFNNFASKLKWFYSGKKYPPSFKNIKDLPSLWKMYAYEFLGITNYLENKITVNYNEWFLNRKYRIKLGKKLRLNSFNKGIKKIAKWGPNNWGDSFDNLKYENGAQKMKVLERWKNYKEDSFYKKLFYDKEIIELSNRIFGEIKGIKSLFY